MLMRSKFKSWMVVSMVLRDSTLESLTPSVNKLYNPWLIKIPGQVTPDCTKVEIH